MIAYEKPSDWIKFDPIAIGAALAEAKAAALSLKTIPYQRRWVEKLQQIQLKREIAGTSQIEGADFTDRELDAAMREAPDQLRTRSQRQAHAAVQTYRWIARWIAKIPTDKPINDLLIREIHRHIVKGADDDHCPPGSLRQRDQNVTFGTPTHRGVEGGEECESTFAEFTRNLQRQYQDYDLMLRAFAAHYHLAAMHPFLDGNGRTARALEALFLQRAGLRDTTFIAMSNYYYDEKARYLASLAEVRRANHDLTQFLIFALNGVTIQCQRLLAEIQHEIARELYRNLMIDLFSRLKTKRKRVIAERQMEVLNTLLEVESIDWHDLIRKMDRVYSSLKNPIKALVRDVNYLGTIKALKIEKRNEDRYQVSVRLEWPTEITETTFFEMVRKLPKAKTHSFLR